MSSFKDLAIKDVYRTGFDDLYNDFYMPLLCNSVRYDRAVGYFSAQILSDSMKGLSKLLNSKGRIRLVIGHPLSEDEFEAVKRGFALSEYVSDLADGLLQIIEEGQNDVRLQVIAILIATGALEIKFAIRRAGMYHEKIGIFHDEEGNKVVFQGSANETPHGMLVTRNAESLSVFKSWEEDIFSRYGKAYEDGFEKLWVNEQPETITVDLPSSAYEKISKVQNESVSSLNLELFADLERDLEASRVRHKQNKPSVPKYLGHNEFKLKKHQRDALNRWKANGYKGILELATGSGKTITAIYGMTKIFEARADSRNRTVAIISVPYVELADQWVENLKSFSIHPIKCYGSKSSWLNKLNTKIGYLISAANDFLAIVVVNKTMASDSFKEAISPLPESSVIFIGDECHNHGSKLYNESLPNAGYKMGLSATPFRSDDDELDSPFANGSRERILDYYDRIVATYSLSDAINDGVLTPYEYHIVPTFLTQEEQDSYDTISERIAKLLGKSSSVGLSKEEKSFLTLLCGQRSRLLGSASNKLNELKKLSLSIPENERAHSLFYSGEGMPFDESDNELNESVIQQVSKVLTESHWRVSSFTSKLNSKKRKKVMQSFKDADIDALIAMKVLDEGVDVPACRSAYILSSTKNPRQYVQRRGRILRRFPGKTLAKIHDFVVLPLEGSSYGPALKRAESERVFDFASLAINRLDVERQIEEIGFDFEQELMG
ncbi:MAG: hypothetical protein C9356_02635 [Oleiphilus sp.]|nr:MAG: hypothetical protein C9356_02635 [Oleiphilus sp.]